MEVCHGGYTDAKIEAVCDHVASRLLLSLDPLLRHAELEASVEKIGRLKPLFLLLLGTTVGIRYACPKVSYPPDFVPLLYSHEQIMNGPVCEPNPPEPKEEALYVFYAIILSTSEKPHAVGRMQ